MCDQGTSNENVEMIVYEPELSISSNENQEIDLDDAAGVDVDHPSRETGGPTRRRQTVRCDNDGVAVQTAGDNEDANVYSCAVPAQVLTGEDGSDVTIEVTPDEVTLQLDYEMHVLDGLDANVEVEPLEAAMLAYLAELFGLGVDGCTGYDVSEEGVRALRPLHRRRLTVDEDDSDTTKIVSISSLQADIPDTQNDCIPGLAPDPAIPSTSCTAINGHRTATYTGTNENAVTSAIAHAIQEGMDKHKFTSTNVPAVTFVGKRTQQSVSSRGDNIINDSVEANTDNTDPTSATNVGGYGAGIISALLVAAAALAALFVHKKKKQQRRAREDSESMLHSHQDKDLRFDLEGVPTDSSDEEDAAWKSSSSLEDNPDMQNEEQPQPVMQRSPTIVTSNKATPTKSQNTASSPMESIKDAPLTVINEDGRDLLKQSLSLRDSPTKAETLMRTQGYLLERISSTGSGSSSSSQPKKKRPASSLLHGDEGQVEVFDENLTDVVEI